MKHILGIGGLFFRAQDPIALKAWYQEVLGMDMSTGAWEQEAGLTAFEPFPADTDYLPKNKEWMLNLRVADLDALKADLEGKGVAVETLDEWDAMPEIGKFARIADPEGNPIELWQPA